MAKRVKTDLLPIPYGRIRKRLLDWFSQSGRDYPWRRTHNWFHLLMAEMMLRRTRADQVLPVYEQFTREFPDIPSTGSLEEEDVVHMLHPLGLQWRAKQVYLTLDYVNHHYRNRKPTDDEDLREIPGVGDYTSAMLRNRIFKERVATVDSNVARFLLRLAGEPYHAESRRNARLIQSANHFVQSESCADLNLAMIDFSALVCKPVGPRCNDCPIQKLCSGSKIK